MKNKKVIIFLIILVICTIGIIILQKLQNKTYAYDVEDVEMLISTDVSNQEKISNGIEPDLNSIIKNNANLKEQKEEIIVEHEELEYLTKYKNNSDLYIGETRISQEGKNGTQAITTKRTFDKNGNLIKEEQVSAVVVKPAINKVIDIGTKKYVQKSDIYIGSTSGALSINIALNKPSGFSLEAFKKMLTDPKDKNKTFENNAKYFYYIEKQYNINGVFVAAVGIHESAWGTSKIARNKKNLFGYGAYDSNPYKGAYTFESYSESIDLVARVFVKYYLNAKGTKIYDGKEASGKYFSGNTLQAVNKKYASDKNWANGVFSHMKYLYSKAK